MAVAIVTGASGLIGSETVRFLLLKGLTVIGIDNNMRSYFFGTDGSTDWNAQKLKKLSSRYIHCEFDIRDALRMSNLFQKYSNNIDLIVHCAAQPSHDWAAKEPLTDFTVNSLATAQLLEFARQHCPDSTFIFTSTNKVYGDRPNSLPLIELSTRWEIDSGHIYATHGIDEQMSVDQSKHSIFGANKISADILCQEYGRYFGMRVGVFRGGCLTGPSHSGAELHGFLSYLAKCQLTGRPYTVFGYKGKQVRDNIHSFDMVNAFWSFYQNPRCGEVYNIGGSRHSNCSVLEAIDIIRELSDKELDYEIRHEARSGDHIWWISDVRKFQEHYPEWRYKHDIKSIIAEIVEAVRERLAFRGSAA